jgi:hypothetical protein
MFMLFCVQVVQTNNNEFSWREKKKQLSSANNKKICKLVKKAKKFNLKNLINKIHKLIVNKPKLNVNHHIKIGRKSQPSSSQIMHSKA